MYLTCDDLPFDPPTGLNEDLIEDDEEIKDEEAKLPFLKPSYLSESHFVFLKCYFTDENPFQEKWLVSCLGYTPVPALDFKGAILLEPDLNPEHGYLVHRFNEFVLLNQASQMG